MPIALVLGFLLFAGCAHAPVARDGAQDWQPLDDESTLYLELDSGRVIIRLAPEFAPRHVENVKALVREGFYDGLGIVRVQDNYVVQWGDSDGTRAIKNAQKTLTPEFFRSTEGLSFDALASRDAYASSVGFSNGFPVAGDSKRGTAWLAHCYGMVGAGRDEAPDSGGGTELYAVSGHAPRHLDRNVTLLGRVVRGMELLSSLPRGTEAMGFYKSPAQRTPIRRVRVAADVPEAERTKLEMMRTDGKAFADLVAAKRYRREKWFIDPAGAIELCNVPLVVREAGTK